jgi:hypothetical protein
MAILPPEDKTNDTHCRGGGMGPRAVLDNIEKRKFLTLSGLEIISLSFIP